MTKVSDETFYRYYEYTRYFLSLSYYRHGSASVKACNFKQLWTLITFLELYFANLVLDADIDPILNENGDDFYIIQLTTSSKRRF